MSEVWVFNGPKTRFPSGVFSSKARAEAWILERRLSGTLTKYPLDQGVYDWAVAQGAFSPKRDEQRTAGFIGSFSSAAQEHEHYEQGVSSGHSAE